MRYRWQELEPKVSNEEAVQSILKEPGIRPSQLLNDYLDRLTDHARMEEKYLRGMVNQDILKWDAESTIEQVNEMMKNIQTELTKITDKSALSEEEAKKVKAMEYANTWVEMLEKRPSVAYWVFNMIKKQVRVIVMSDEQKLEEKDKAEGGPERRAFKGLLSEYLYEPYHLTYSYEDVEPQLNSKRRWKAVKTEEQRKTWYSEFLGELKEKLDKKSKHHHHHRHHRTHSRNHRG